MSANPADWVRRSEQQPGRRASPYKRTAPMDCSTAVRAWWLVWLGSRDSLHQASGRSSGNVEQLQVLCAAVALGLDGLHDDRGRCRMGIGQQPHCVQC